MSNAQLAVLVAAALFVFWMLGAYNRLVALRNAIGDAWQMVDEVLKKRGDAIGAIAAALREPLAAELQAAEAQMSSAASRVLALLAQHAELNASEAVSPHAQALVECAQRLGFARQMFNDAAQVYNAAARQFPTRLLTRLYGFGTAGRL